ncbi:MAG: FISUMP domain-containing protein [Paludibacter sp.]|jgi:uncharacterized protein (TIGR02145 family)|nr:FISUMP domain-containing protein [Paludibacter sp.]
MRISNFDGSWKAIAFLAVVFFLFSCQNDAPTVETVSVDLLSGGKIQVIGKIISDGGEDIQQRGLCFSLHPNPVLLDQYKEGVNHDYKDPSLFSATFDNIGPNEECYVRAYAINEVGIGYGDVLMFKNSTKPLVATAQAQNITKTEAVLKGSVNPLKSEAEVWFEIWPKGGVSKKINLSSVSGEMPIEVNIKIEELSISQVYYYVLKARNEYGESIGDTLQFETYAVSDVDGNLYHITNINGQIWLRENFRGTRYANGDPIPYVSNLEEWKTLTTGAYCWYNHDPKIGEIYGGLYNWYTASDPRGLIIGWHTPAYDEFKELSDFIKNGTLSPSATSLMEAGTSHWLNRCSSPYLTADNSTGFTALPNGILLPKQSEIFQELGYSSSWWGKDSFSDSGHSVFIQDCEFSYNSYSGKRLGMGIRLIKN